MFLGVVERVTTGGLLRLPRSYFRPKKTRVGDPRRGSYFPGGSSPIRYPPFFETGKDPGGGIARTGAPKSLFRLARKRERGWPRKESTRNGGPENLFLRPVARREVLTRIVSPTQYFRSPRRFPPDSVWYRFLNPTPSFPFSGALRPRLDGNRLSGGRSKNPATCILCMRSVYLGYR